MDLKYVNKTGDRHTFHVLSDGNRPVLAVYVDENPSDADAKLSVLVNGIGKGPDDIQKTKGTTHAVTKDDGKTRVCVGCLSRYIVPRLVTLMARVYVPVQIAPLSESMLDDFKI